jgi:hypothetical protein
VGRIVKLGIPVLVVIAIGAGGWLYLESSGNGVEAGRAAGAVINAADRAIDAARAGDTYGKNEENNFVTVGAIFTANGNVRATLVVRGSKGAAAICNRMAFVRDYLVVLMSDYPPEKGNLAAGPAGYPGSLETGINEVVEQNVVTRIRFDAYNLGQPGGSASC